MTDAALPAQAIDHAGVVTANVPCRKCSYSVKGLNVTSRCPECGAPVGVALHGELLRYGDPQWVQNLAKGARFVFWGILVSVGVGFLAGVATIFAGQWIAPMLGMVAGLIHLYGAWLLTEPDPSGLGEDIYGRARQIIRITLATGLLSQFLQLIVATGKPDSTTTIVINIVQTGVALIGVIGHFAMLRYLERLAMRIPDAALSRSARVLFWGYGCTMAAAVLIGGVAATAIVIISKGGGQGARGPSAATVGTIGGVAFLGCAAAIALLVFGIMFLVLLWRLAMAFDLQAVYSRGIWAGATDGAPVAAQNAP